MSDAQKIAQEMIEQGKLEGITEPAEVAAAIREHAVVISDLSVMDVLRELRKANMSTAERAPKKSTLTVADLIAELSKWPADAPVDLALLGANSGEPETAGRITGVSVSTTNAPFTATRLSLLLATAN